MTTPNTATLQRLVFLCTYAGAVYVRPEDMQVSVLIGDRVDVSFACECGERHAIPLVRDYALAATTEPGPAPIPFTESMAYARLLDASAIAERALATVKDEAEEARVALAHARMMNSESRLRGASATVAALAGAQVGLSSLGGFESVLSDRTSFTLHSIARGGPIDGGYILVHANGPRFLLDHLQGGRLLAGGMTLGDPMRWRSSE